MTFVRREVRSLPSDHLQAYADAVGVMKERPDDDPTSWAYQAAIHGIEASPLPQLADQCKHGSWFFLPWHRMYLYYFERIVRDIVIANGGPEDWALPYWNYGLDEAHASLPDEFRSATNADGSPNPLFVGQRAPGFNEGAVLDAAITSDAAALARPKFVGFAEFGGAAESAGELVFGLSGVVERTPHNDIHVAVGEGGWMISTDLAAQDPIFWLHHANIDRIWAVWNSEGKTNPNAPKWAGQTFEFFDVDGSTTSKKCADVGRTIEDLDYTYDVLPAAVTVSPEEPPEIEPFEFPDAKVVGATTDEVPLTGETKSIPIEIDERARDEVIEASRESDPRRLYLNIENITGDVNPGTVYGVYVNLPDDPSRSDLDAHHLTNVSFFGIERARNPRQDEHPHSMRVSVDVADLLAATGEGDTWDGNPIDVTFRPIPLVPGEGQTEEYLLGGRPAKTPPVRIGRVSLAVE